MSLLCAALSSVTPRSGVALVLLALSAPILPGCGSQRAAPKSAGSGAGAAPIAYDVQVGPTLDLAIEMTIPVAAGLGTLSVDRPAMGYVSDLSVDGDRRRVASRKEGFEVACVTAPCRIKYRFLLRDAARHLADVDRAAELGGAVVAPPSTWLLRPATAGFRYRFRVEGSPGLGFATGVRSTTGAEGRIYEGDLAEVDASAFAVFGEVKILPLSPPGIEAAFVSGLSISDELLASWLAAELSVIGTYFGHAPDDRLLIIVAPGTAAVTRGETLGAGGASVLVRLGTEVTAEALRDDWVVAHELVHVAFPSLDYKHNWFSEGLATYVEPVARARRGLVSTEKFWADLVEGLPQGLPRDGDRGLEGTMEWGRVYWGGALYFLLADLAIREQTDGARSLDDALRAIARPGVNVETNLSMAEVLELGDSATGTRVMHDLFANMAVVPGAIDLDALWVKLGIRQLGRSLVAFDDRAPAARFRLAITAGGSTLTGGGQKNRTE
jgi:hypothetical protein